MFVYPPILSVAVGSNKASFLCISSFCQSVLKNVFVYFFILSKCIEKRNSLSIPQWSPMQRPFQGRRCRWWHRRPVDARCRRVWPRPALLSRRPSTRAPTPTAPPSSCVTARTRSSTSWTRSTKTRRWLVFMYSIRRDSVKYLWNVWPNLLGSG